MQDTLQDTGERYLPWSGDMITGYEHVHRYLLAAHYARDRRVLDISCGEGYGTSMLAQVARFVVGVDIDAATIAHARARHGKENTAFIRADAEHFALAAGSVDVAVSFETIEHFEEHTSFLNAIKTSLAPNGILLVSTPNIRTYRSESDQSNPFHKRELGRAEFLRLLGGHFKHIQFYGQRLVTSSAITRDKAGFILRNNDSVRVMVTEIDVTKADYPLRVDSAVEPRYHIAICSNAALPLRPSSLMVDTNETLYADFLAHFTGWYDLNKECLRLRENLDQTDARAVQIGADLRAERMQLQQTRDELIRSQGELARSHKQLNETQGELSQTHIRLRRADSDVTQARIRLTRALATRVSGTNMTLSENGRQMRKVLIIIPGSVNYFYNQAGRRISAAMHTLGFDVDIHTLHSATKREYDWCFLINPYELTVSYGDQSSGIQRIRDVSRWCERTVAVLLECAQTPWFRHSYHLCGEAGIDTLLDFGFHDQSALLSDDALPRYIFVFNGLTESERAKVYDESPVANDHAVPWVFVGHLSRSRVSLVSQLLQESNPGGVVYMPYLTPVTENGPHINEQQFETILRHTKYQVWCAHHDYLYLESERFRNSLLSGSLPIKVLLHPLQTTAILPFHYLLTEEHHLAAHMNNLDRAFDATWQRFKEEFRRLPTLEDGIVDALATLSGQRR
jgi:SAM-dependent methyltransferase